METPGDNPVPYDDASRARRARLVPPWVAWTGVTLVGVSVLLLVFFLWRDRAIQRQVPKLVGLTLQEAQAEARKAGLVIREGDRRFSVDAPKGFVLEQQPPAGSVLDVGGEVVVAVSAGSETFQMPQVVGADVSAAERLLESRGLSVEIESVSSESPTGTVLASFPEAGTTITTSDVVRLTVASGEATSDLLLPIDLAGRKIAIDPAPIPDVTVDTTMEVARRLRALLQASGGTVVVTRSASDRQATDSTRAARAKKASPDVLLVLSVAETGTKGVSVTMSQVKGTGAPSSAQLAEAILAALKQDRLAEGATSPGVDTVLSAVPVAGAEVSLGSLQDPSDVQRLKDPTFAEQVARGLYRGIANALSPSD